METVNTKTTQYEEDEANSDSGKETFTEIKTLESSSNGDETSCMDSSNSGPNTNPLESDCHRDETIKRQSGSNEIVLHYFADTTLHGLNHACLAGVTKVRRGLWLLLLLAMTACYLTLTVYSVQRYYKYESATSFSRKSVDSLDFPAVSVCDINLVPKSAIDADPELHRLIARLGSEGGLDKLNLTTAQMQSARHILSKHNMADLILYDIEVFDMIELCTFNAIEDCKHRLSWISLSETTLCWTFQHREDVDDYGDVRTTLPGWVYGLRKCPLSSRYSCSKISSYSYVYTINLSLLTTENGQIGLGNGIRMHRFASGKMCVG